MRSGPDATVSGEPYLALMLFLDTGTGRFFARVWNKTTVTGRMVKMAEFSQVSYRVTHLNGVKG